MLDRVLLRMDPVGIPSLSRLSFVFTDDQQMIVSVNPISNLRHLLRTAKKPMHSRNARFGIIGEDRMHSYQKI